MPLKVRPNTKWKPKGLDEVLPVCLSSVQKKEILDATRHLVKGEGSARMIEVIEDRLRLFYLSRSHLEDRPQPAEKKMALSELGQAAKMLASALKALDPLSRDHLLEVAGEAAAGP